MEVGREAFLALVPIDQGFSVEGFVIGDDHAALGAGHHFGGIEGECTRQPEGAGRPAPECTAVGMGGVLDERDAGAVANLLDLGEVPA